MFKADEKLNLTPDEVEYKHCFSTGTIKFRMRYDTVWQDQSVHTSLKATVNRGELTKLPRRVSMKIRKDRLPHVVSFGQREYILFYPASQAYKEWIRERINENL